MTSHLWTLFRSVGERRRPEDVAHEILGLRFEMFTRRERKLIDRAARRSRGLSSMPHQFAQADDMSRQLAVARKLFSQVTPPKPKDDPDAVNAYIGRLNEALRKQGRDFLAHRLNSAERHSRGVKLGHRAYNKRFRLVQRMEAKHDRWLRARTMRELAQIAKTRLACWVTWEEFSWDLDTACFVAYMTARLGVRSTFTWGKQQRPYDEIADMLLDRCLASADTTLWWPIALVHPVPEVLEHLSGDEQGRLVALWFQVMHTAAEILEQTAESNDLDLEGLVVRRGNDSSTWNEAAGAFNKAREGWINTLHALGMADLLDSFAPGKALRLMAADVVKAHRWFGSGGLEPDTDVWRELPLPWEVVLGRAQCRRVEIEAACFRHGINGKGWIAPRPKRVARFRPTPDLVHGVEVGSPHLAAVLRRCGYFSGPSKGLKAVAPVAIDRVVVDSTVVVTEAIDATNATRH